MSSQVMEHASIPRNHSLYNNLGMRESPGEGRRRGREKGRGGKERGPEERKREGERGLEKRNRREGMRAISCTCTCVQSGNQTLFHCTIEPHYRI